MSRVKKLGERLSNNNSRKLVNNNGSSRCKHGKENSKNPRTGCIICPKDQFERNRTKKGRIYTMTFAGD